MKPSKRFTRYAAIGLFSMVTISHAALWTPTELSLAAWYDASDAGTITITGSGASSWLDKSGNGLHLTQATDGDRPAVITSGMNGLNVLEFANRTEDMDSTSTITLSQGWVAVVLQYNNASPLFATALGTDATNGDNYTVQYRGDVNADRWQGAYHTNGNAASNTGASAITSPAIVIHNGIDLTGRLLNIGGDRGLNGRGWDGYIAEVIYGTTLLDTDQRQTLEGYLAHKWMGAGASNPLDALHPYKNTAPAIPEPSAMLFGAFGSLLLLRRRR